MEQQSEIPKSIKKSRHRHKKNKKSSKVEIVSQNIITENTQIAKSEPQIVDSIVNKLEEDKSSNDKTDVVKSHVNLEIKNKDSEKPLTMSTPQQNLSRDEIKAEREAKKLAKQTAKKKSTENKQTDSPKPTQNPKNIVEKPTSQSPKSTENISTPKNVTLQSLPNKLEQSPSSQASENSTPKSSHTDKTKEEVKAEREAKKLAKQMAKMKVKDYSIKTDDNNKSEVKTEKNITPVSKQESKEDKSKSELRAERRAKQEAQRAAKQAQVEKPKTPQSASKPVVKPKIVSEQRASQSPDKTKAKPVNNEHKVKLFNHLYPEKDSALTFSSMNIPMNSKDIHPAFIRLGVQYASRIVVGSNARCIALLNALKEVLDDYSLPPNVEFSRGFESHIAPCLKFLKTSRPASVSMNNAMKNIKWHLTQLENSISEYNAKAKIHEAIETYIRDQIEVAGEAISIAVCQKISPGDVILTYGCSSLIERILTEAATAKKSFRVIVVAAHPWNEGQEMLRRLTLKDIKCTLVMISALSFVMREVNKVILGAGALLANGYVMARAGTAQVAMVAHAHNVPVLVCCETHKFSERVQTDSFVYNEIGDPDDLINCDPSLKDNQITNWRAFNSLTPLNLTYDVTPPDLVTAVVTELAILPCTSVPVILRMKPSEFVV